MDQNPQNQNATTTLYPHHNLYQNELEISLETQHHHLQKFLNLLLTWYLE